MIAKSALDSTVWVQGTKLKSSALWQVLVPVPTGPDYWIGASCGSHTMYPDPRKRERGRERGRETDCGSEIVSIEKHAVRTQAEWTFAVGTFLISGITK